MADNEATLNNTDIAIKECESSIRKHDVQKSLWLTLTIGIICLLVLAQGSMLQTKNSNLRAYTYYSESISRNAKEINNNINSYNHYLVDAQKITDTLNKLSVPVFEQNLITLDPSASYFVYGVFIILFGVFTSFYRYHLKESSKYEQFKFGLMRIRIAATNGQTKYEDEVRSALVKDVFDIETKPLISKEKKIESPIPGHPSSDISAMLLNKMLQSLEVVVKPKEK